LEPLRSSDLRAVLEFVETAWALSGERPFTPETLAALQQLIPSDLVGYSELDRLNGQTIQYFNSEGGEGDDGGEEELFWSLVEDHPLCRHQFAYHDFSALRLSDVIGARQLAGTRVHADWFRPAGVVAELEAGIAPSRVRTRNFVLDRSHGDFSDRDLAVLERVRPHLALIHETARLRQDVAGVAPPETGRLSPREEEVLELVAAGLTNAEIAERLWISPGTVKKHLDNIYDRLGVRGRAAAVARAGLKRN
jgi:DNA-binding CsgD family transcriptional regulator